MSTRREATRTRLQTAAVELFAEHGYDATTVAQVAARAGVTEMTAFRHFPSKADLVLDDPYDPVMVDALRRQDTGLPPLVRVARAVREAWREVPEPAAAHVRARMRVAAASPTLRGSLWRNTARTERMLAEQLVADGTPRPIARVAASAALAALMTSLLDWASSEVGELGEAIESALGVVDHGHD
ncbi:TetR/AcrR family transcriptional regulator [Nocardioides sp.]|uniref:TetR/AcrR family transcriptional regulator n=1 Tax=Nocardioides sp. TaxID=35761 RepID=UPI002737415A|nr:TetR/AcrR family transcriptional regulator [Nocardioides sp.]MDP3894974.1 helix-turn-helix domain-containing protein [Nocardioides sp.]